MYARAEWPVASRAGRSARASRIGPGAGDGGRGAGEGGGGGGSHRGRPGQSQRQARQISASSPKDRLGDSATVRVPKAGSKAGDVAETSDVKGKDGTLSGQHTPSPDSG